MIELFEINNYRDTLGQNHHEQYRPKKQAYINMSEILTREFPNYSSNLSDQMVKNKMMVLDENGDVQMQLDGGERIFSRHDTKILIKFAKKAYDSKDPEDYKKLGKKLFKFLEIQMGNETQYVELKDK